MARLALGLLLVAATGACSAATQRGERTVVIDIEHSRFHPVTLHVAAGTVVQFVVRNRDPIDHEFIVGDERVHARHEDGTERRHGERPGEVSVPALEEGSTTYTFDEKGTFAFACHLPNHYDYGMHGEIHIR